MLDEYVRTVTAEEINRQMEEAREEAKNDGKKDEVKPDDNGNSIQIPNIRDSEI